jgi:hypothetical protein
MRHVWGKRNVYRILVGRAEGNIPLEKPRHNWEDNIKMYHKNMGGS